MLRKKTDFMTEYISGKEEEKRREKLRRRHRTDDASVRVIEKDHGFLPVLKFLWLRLEGFVRTIFSGIIFILAAIGVISLLLETSRSIIVSYFTELYRIIF